MSGGKKAPIFYIFKLEAKMRLDGKTMYKFIPFKIEDPTKMFPYIEDHMTKTMTQRINYQGVLSQCLIKSSVESGDGKTREVDVVVKVQKTYDPSIEKKTQSRSFFSFGGDVEEVYYTMERYRFLFDSASHNDKRIVLRGKIEDEKKRVELKIAKNADLLNRLK